MKRLLLVSAVFPPQLGGTSEKMARRAKYFLQNGWQTVVLAPKIPDGTKVDPSLLEQTNGSEIHRTDFLFSSRLPSLRHDKQRPISAEKQSKLFDLFFVPKGYIRWLPYAIHKALQLAPTVDVILTMNNPITLHIVGYILHKITRKPWVIEIRDPIVEYSYGIRGPEGMNYFLEKLFVKNADAIIQRIDGAPEPVRSRYPKEDAKFHHIMYAGYDADDFIGLETESLEKNSNQKEILISYTGSFYGSTITPLPFLRGLRRFLNNSHAGSERIQALFAGDWNRTYDQIINEMNLQSNARHIGYLTHQDCINLWRKSQILLLILGKEEENRLRIPSKFWDYLGVRKPILALVCPDGETARLIREQNLGFVADPEDEQDIARALQCIFEAYQSDCLIVKPDDNFYTSASRAFSEKQVVEVLEKVSHAH